MNSRAFAKRAISGVLRRIQRPIDAFYRTRHPGPVGRSLIRAAAPLVRRMVPNDRWSLPVHAPYWMQAASVHPRSPQRASKRIFMFCLYRGQFTLDLSLAALLAWRGHKVILGYLPRLGSPVKPPFEDDPSAEPYLSAALADLSRASGGKVGAVNMASLASSDVRVDEESLSRQAVADAVIRLGTESVDPANIEHAEAVARYRMLGERTQRAAAAFFAARAHEFDLILLANGMSFEAAHVLKCAVQAGLDVVTFEKFAFRKVRIVNHGSPVFSFQDLALLWRHRAELGFDTEPFRSRALERAMELLGERRRASVRNWAWKYQFAPDQDNEETISAAGIDLSLPYILVCTNVPFDAGFYQFTTLFRSMRDWLVETVRFLLNETDTQVVVRIHPGEMLHYGGRERSVDNLAEAGVTPHPRLIVIAPEAKVNTYPLMERCRAGVVFSSTTGIEMAMLGRPVVVGADVYYGNKGFTRDCDSRPVYFDILRKVAAGDIDTAESRRCAAAARLFYYMLHFVLQHPYPYDKGVDLVRTPPHRLVASAEIENYLKLLDVLTMSPDEFERELVFIYRERVLGSNLIDSKRPLAAIES